MLELNKIYNWDCLFGMKDIDDKSIDMICCDLPYEVLNRNNQSAQWDISGKKTKKAWDFQAFISYNTVASHSSINVSTAISGSVIS